MSQNTPGSEFDKGFLDTDVDLEIGLSSPDAEIYASSSGFQWPSFSKILFFLVIFSGLAGGGYYVGYETGLENGRRSLPPVVLADKAPLKVPADQLPQSADEADEKLNIYGVLQGEGNGQQLSPNDILEGPADNASGTIESLIEQTLTVPETASDSRASVKVVEAINKTIRKPVETAKVTSPEPRPTVVAEPAQSEPAKSEPTQSAATRQDFMVQLSAVRNRAIARGNYSALQKKHDDLLGRRDALIIRTDLGDKGIYYRVNVPGFPDKSAANAFCASLKKRGQDCLVRKQPSS
jgi:cell division septation protein DedD